MDHDKTCKGAEKGNNHAFLPQPNKPEAMPPMVGTDIGVGVRDVDASLACEFDRLDEIRLKPAAFKPSTCCDCGDGVDVLGAFIIRRMASKRPRSSSSSCRAIASDVLALASSSMSSSLSWTGESFGLDGAGP